MTILEFCSDAIEKVVGCRIEVFDFDIEKRSLIGPVVEWCAWHRNLSCPR